MDLELLDQLEDRVDVAVTTVRDLRTENELLKEETQELEKKVDDLERDLAGAREVHGQLEPLRARCEELERKLEGVRGRIEKMVDKMRALEG